MDRVVRRLVTVYGVPQGVADPKELFGEFFKALNGYSPEILSTGCDRVIRDRAFSSWPTVGEVVKACRDVADEAADRTHRQPTADEPVFEPVSQEQAAHLLGQAMQHLDPRRSFPNMMATARAWAKHHNCKVIVDVDQDPPMTDEHGRVIPFGWKPGQAA